MTKPQVKMDGLPGSWMSGVKRLGERTGKWPSKLKGGLVCLLPKGGVGPSVADPLQARPVVLLSVLYRIWGKARSRWLEQWIKEAGMQHLEESGRPART